MSVIQYQEFIPHAILQHVVKRFWVLEKEYTRENSIEEVIPDACIELVLNFGSAYVQMGGSTPRQLPKACMIGLLNKPLLLQAQGVVKIVAIRMFAWGPLSLLKNGMSQTETEEVELDSSWQNVLSKIKANVHAGLYHEVVDELEDFLIGQSLNKWFDPQQIKLAARLLYHTKGQFRVTDLADTLNVSVRQLQRQFKDATGVSPKILARTIRFEAIRNRLMFEPDTNLTDLAYEFGYTDQAHFINDFKAFTDKTPGEYAAEMRKLQQMFHDHSSRQSEWCHRSA